VEKTTLTKQILEKNLDSLAFQELQSTKNTLKLHQNKDFKKPFQTSLRNFFKLVNNLKIPINPPKLQVIQMYFTFRIWN
jgi:hypothetical protein